MRVTFLIGTPHQVHLFKNLYRELERKGIESIFLARDYSITTYLLKKFNLKYKIIGYSHKNIGTKFIEFLTIYKNSLKYIMRFKSNLTFGDFLYGLPSSNLRIPSISFTNGDAGIDPIIYRAISKCSLICTPEHYRIYLGEKHVRYPGFQQLAYLHPSYFVPNSEVLDDVGLSKNDKFCIIRLNSYDAIIHDLGIKPLTVDELMPLIKNLEKFGYVFILPESKCPKAFYKYKLKIAPEKLHDLLYFADLLIADTAMVTEACLLGTPSIFIRHPKLIKVSDFKILKKYGFFNLYGIDIEEKFVKLLSLIHI